MASPEKILESVLGGRADANVRFNDLRRLLLRLGFSERVRGDHFIYARSGVMEIINLQPAGGGKAKPYQVKQVRQLVLQYQLRIEA